MQTHVLHFVQKLQNRPGGAYFHRSDVTRPTKETLSHLQGKSANVKVERSLDKRCSVLVLVFLIYILALILSWQSLMKKHQINSDFVLHLVNIEKQFKPVFQQFRLVFQSKLF